MNVTQIIAQLREERAALDQAIAVLEKIARSGPRGRGRPPSWLSSVSNAAGPKRTFSAATRKRMAEAQRKRWAAYREERGTT
jgi:hypothetical protein